MEDEAVLLSSAEPVVKVDFSDPPYININSGRKHCTVVSSSLQII